MKHYKGIWKRLPFARLLISCFLGILVDQYLEPRVQLLGLGLLLTAALLLLFHFLPLWLRWKINAFKGLALMALLLMASALHHRLHTDTAAALQAEGQGYLLHIADKKETAQSLRYTAKIFVVENNLPIPKGACYVYLNKHSQQRVQKGDLIFTTAAPKRITNNSNPGSFDFVAYAARKGIFYSLYMGSARTWVLLSSRQEKPSLMEKTRKKILDILSKQFRNSEHLGLAEAMLIGYRDDLDSTLLNAYIDTGVVHIIAISGLHLGLIFMLLDKLVVLLVGRSRSTLGALFISIPLLWAFALLTGGSASVLRSALMFSLMILAKAIGRNNASMNALLGSAFLLLLYDPQLVYDLGFQLSYAAVGSILLFDGWIKNWIYLNNPIMKYAWGMVSITLAAQILTTPLVILHFQRFPILFLFANLVAVPLSSAILVGEMILIAVHPLESVATGLTTVIGLMIGWMNSYVWMISTIPHAVLEEIHISTPMMVLSYLLIFLLKTSIHAPSKQRWSMLLGLVLLVALLRLGEKKEVHNKKNIMVLNLPYQSCIVVQNGIHGAMYTQEAVIQDSKKIKMLMKQTSKATGIRQWKMVVIPAIPLLVSWNKTNGLLPHQTRPFTVIIGQILRRDTGGLKNVSRGFSSKYPKTTLKGIGAVVPAGATIVADGSNTVWKIREWEKEAHELHLRLHATPEKGAFILP